MVALMGFRMPSSDAEVKVAAAPTLQALPALTAAPREELIPRVVDAARSREEVTGVAEIRSGTRWLNSWSAEGFPPAGPPPGFQVPVDAASVDPEQFKKLVPEQVSSKIGELANGGAILSRTGAALRGITAGGALQFPNISIPVIGVVDDPIVRDHELMVSHATGTALGLEETRYLVIGLNRLGAGKAVEAAMRKAIPPDVFMRVRGPAGSGASDLPSPLLSIGEIKTRFGEFPAVSGTGANIRIDQAWVDANTEMASIHRLGVFRCHKKAIPQIAAAFREVEDAGLGDLIRPNEFGGCFSPRYIRSGREAGLSRHAWGIAFDFNVSGNLYGQPPTMDMRLVEIMERHGFSWGGRWNYPDGMHFEYIFPGPA
jgi:hypothetical protein